MAEYGYTIQAFLDRGFRSIRQPTGTTSSFLDVFLDMLNDTLQEVNATASWTWQRQNITPVLLEGATEVLLPANVIDIRSLTLTDTEPAVALNQIQESDRVRFFRRQLETGIPTAYTRGEYDGSTTTTPIIAKIQFDAIASQDLNLSVAAEITLPLFENPGDLASMPQIPQYLFSPVMHGFLSMVAEHMKKPASEINRLRAKFQIGVAQALAKDRGSNKGDDAFRLRPGLSSYRVARARIGSRFGSL